MIQSYLMGGVAAVGLLVGVWFHGHSTGSESVEAEYNQAILSAQQKSKTLADQLAKEKQKIKVEYRDRVKKIYVAEDVSGCADSTIPDWVRDSVHREAG